MSNSVVVEDPVVFVGHWHPGVEAFGVLERVPRGSEECRGLKGGRWEWQWQHCFEKHRLASGQSVADLLGSG